MTVKDLCERLELEVICEGQPQREVAAGYAGDLLSWVMGRAPQDCAWITIMSNKNVAAVALLADVSCVVLAEGVRPDEGLSEQCEKEGITLAVSQLSTFDAAGKIYAMIANRR